MFDKMSRKVKWVCQEIGSVFIFDFDQIFNCVCFFVFMFEKYLILTTIIVLIEKCCSCLNKTRIESERVYWDNFFFYFLFSHTYLQYAFIALYLLRMSIWLQLLLFCFANKRNEKKSTHIICKKMTFAPEAG